MSSLIQKISSILSDALGRAFPEADKKVEVTEATAEKFGHYQCNSAMALAKLLKKSPRQIAEGIVSHIVDSEKLFDKVEIANPGFINITLSPIYLAQKLHAILQDPEQLDVDLYEKKERVIVDFSQPNIAKEMHVGHLRSTIIGDAIARLFEFLGADVLRLNHLGDWGTAFGMLIAYMEEVAPDVLKGGRDVDLPTLMQWYRASKKRFDEDEEFKTRSRLRVVSLQAYDPESMTAWEKICEISQKAYREIYRLLDVDLIDRGESFYNFMIPQMIQDLESRGIIQVSEGAKCIFIEGQSIPLMIQKSDGGFGYDTTDMAAMLHRIETEKADRIIITTDNGQCLHFELVYQAAIKAGYLDPKKVRFDHVPFGLVLGADGKKFRTRAGDVEKLIDLLTAAITEAKKLLIARDTNMTDQELDQLAHVLGIDAIKYADLSSNRVNDYLFSYDRMLKFEGNTATFILYSYVRVQGIKRKIPDVDIEALIKSERIVLEHESEIVLGLHLIRFSDTLRAFAEYLLPHYLTDYLYLLAQKFNVFFRDCQVMGVKEQASRLLLCELVARTLHKGLTILGIKTVEKM